MKTKTYDKNQINLLIDDLRAGEVVAIATDTVMGLAARADSVKAFEILKRVKGRPHSKPFPIMVANLDQLKKIVNLNSRDLNLVNKWFPGAITFIFNKKNKSNLVGELDTLAVRIPDDKVIIEIVSKLDVPIFLTSANISNEPTTMKALETLEVFDGKIKSILMRNALGYKPSTIIDASKSELIVLREGNISLEEIIESLEE